MHSSQIVILISSRHMHHVSRFESRLSYHPHGHPRACVLFALTFSFYFLLFLPSLFLFLTDKKFMANLYNSAKEGVDTNDVLSFPTIEKPTAKAAPPSEPPTPRAQVRREKGASEAEVRLAELFNNRADIFLKGTCTRSPCEYWHPPECQFIHSKLGCKFGNKCSFRTGRSRNNKIKSPRRVVTKEQWLL